MNTVIFEASSMVEVDYVYDLLLVLHNLNIMKIDSVQFVRENGGICMVCTLSDDHRDYI